MRSSSIFDGEQQGKSDALSRRPTARTTATTDATRRGRIRSRPRASGRLEYCTVVTRIRSCTFVLYRVQGQRGYDSGLVGAFDDMVEDTGFMVEWEVRFPVVRQAIKNDPRTKNMAATLAHKVKE